MDEVYNPTYIIIKKRRVNGVFGVFFNHYFIELDGIEYHLKNWCKVATYIQNYTRNATIVGKKQICQFCKLRLLALFENENISFLFPFVNCESFVFGISNQFCVTLIVVSIIVLSYYGISSLTLAVIITILVLLIFLFKSISKRNSKFCKHLKH